MNNHEKERFVELIAGVHEFFGKPMSRFSLEVWTNAMRGYDLAAVSDALSRHTMNPDSGQFMPKPADVVRMIDGGTADSALVAWSKFDKALRSVGSYMTVAFDDPIIHRVIEDMGGWTSFDLKTEDEWPFVKNEFATRYRGYAGRRASFAYKPKLLGRIDSDRESKGLAHESRNLRTIGDQRRAIEVMRLGCNTPAIGIGQVAESTLLLLAGGSQ